MALVGNIGDRWQSALCDHELFAWLRERLKSAEEMQKRKSGSRVQLKNLICSVDGDLLVWHQEDCAFSTVRLRNLGSDPPGSGGEQKLLCINPPVFEVTDVLLSPTQNHIALLGAKGLMVLKVPDRWGKNSEFEGGKEEVNCRTIPIAERIFTCSTSLMLNQASWYPSEVEEARLVLLTSDNTIRIYNLQDPLTPEKVISLSTSDEETELPYNGRSYKASLGETAVAFDFGPLVSVPKAFAMKNKEETLAYPLYILYENGQTFMIYINLQESVGGAGKLLGPLPMHPAADDNYGYDACAVLCLPCVPNILVIATESGLLYHCVVLEGEDDDDQMSDKSWNPSMDLVPSLYVFECVELELALKLPSSQEETADSDFACPIKLHRDNCSFRFHCIHMAGVHSVAVTWLSKVQTFLNEAQEDKDNLLELAADQKCLVEHILCTKPLPSREPAPIQGFWIISDISLGTAMICITSDFECITRPLMTNVHLPPPHLLSSQIDSSSATEAIPYTLADVKGSFESHIMGILSRNAANPLLLNSSKKDKSPSPEECLQLLSRATQVFREEYVLKQDLAEEEIQRRVKLLVAQKEKQMKDLSQCNEERKLLKEMAERLAEKFEEAKEKHDDLTNRFKKVLRAFHTQLPVLSDSEREMKKELQVTNGQLQYLENAVKQVKMKMSYQEKQMQKGKSPRKATLNLSGYKLKNIQSVLKEEGENIQSMVKQINNIRTHVNF